MDLGNTIWKNPTEQDVLLRLFVAPGQFAEYKIPAKGQASVPSQFDHAIHQLRDGVIVGGFAPQLARDGAATPTHPAIAPAEKPERPAPRR